MDDPTLGEMLARNRDGMGGAAVMALLFSATYSIAKGFDLRMAARAAVSCVIFATAGWFFLVNYLHLPIYWIVPVGLGAAYVTVPLAKAWARRDDRLADKAMDAIQRRTTGNDK